MIGKFLSKLMGAPVERVAEYFSERQRLKHELKVAKIEGKIATEKAKAAAQAKRQEHVANWELLQIQNSGWKDEFVLITLSFGIYGSFIPGLQEYILRGFEVLSKTPPWYVAIIVAVFLAIYGIRWNKASKIQLPGGTE